MSENLIEQYLAHIGEIRETRSNVAETSFYPALERLLTEIGKTLTPKVRCVINLANRGAGIPDGGLFSADQFRRQSRDAETKNNPFLGQTPARGVIEAKPPADDVFQVAATEQVERLETIRDGSGHQLQVVCIDWERRHRTAADFGIVHSGRIR